MTKLLLLIHPPAYNSISAKYESYLEDLRTSNDCLFDLPAFEPTLIHHLVTPFCFKCVGNNVCFTMNRLCASVFLLMTTVLTPVNDDDSIMEFDCCFQCNFEFGFNE